MPEGFLGIWDGHDSSVALVCDGVLVFALSEERLSRRKRAAGFPIKALEACLTFAEKHGVVVKEVVLAGSYGRAPLRWLDTLYARGDQSRDPMSFVSRVVANWENSISLIPVFREVEKAVGLSAFLSRLKHILPLDVRLITISHHDAHAGSALLCRAEGPALVITMDAYGEGFCATVRASEQPKVVLSRLPPRHSIAAVYGALTVAMGFREGEEGKVMGLAAAGRPEVAIGRFLDLWKECDGIPLLRQPINHSVAKRLLNGLSLQDAAAGLQAATVYLTTRYISRVVAEAQRPQNLLLAGGLFNNILVNQAVASIPGIKDVSVFPNMGDGGLSAGAAAMRFYSVTGRLPEPIRDVFLGTEHSEAEIREAIKRSGLRVRRCKDAEGEAAHHISKGRVVCRWTGRDEFGPRALGNRSVLFRADSPKLAERVNKALGRDSFMPFGPAVLDVEGLWRSPLSPSRLRYMTFAVEATGAMRKLCPVAVHLDGTTRPQVVDVVSAPSFYRLLQEYRDITGVPAIINTSFNLHGEPIVHSPTDAISTFIASGLDVLFMDRYEIRRPGLEDLG